MKFLITLYIAVLFSFCFATLNFQDPVVLKDLYSGDLCFERSFMDIDLDGDDDIVHIDNQGWYIKWVENDDMSFRNVHEFYLPHTGIDPLSEKNFGNINGDGYLDVIVPYGNVLKVYFGGPNVTFTEHIILTSFSMEVPDFKIIDLTGDGMGEIVIFRENSIYSYDSILGTFNSTFITQNYDCTSHEYYDIHYADYEDDNDIDILTIFNDNQVDSLYFNWFTYDDSLGYFQSPIRYSFPENHFRQAFICKKTNSGLQNVVLLDLWGNMKEYVNNADSLNDITQNYSSFHTINTPNLTGEISRVLPIDTQSFNPYSFCALGQNRVEIFTIMNNQYQSLSTLDIENYELKTCKINDDDFDELNIYSGQSDIIRFSNNDDFRTGTARPLLLSAAKDLEVLDINGDGRDDIRLTGHDYSLNLYKTAFSISDADFLNDKMRIIDGFTVGNLDNDPEVEFIYMIGDYLVPNDYGKIKIRGLSDNDMTLSSDFIQTTGAISRIADLDNDNLNDIVIYLPENHTIRVYLNANGFSNQIYSEISLAGITELIKDGGFEITDLNNDGFPDILLMYHELNSQRKISYAFNNGSGNFTSIADLQNIAGLFEGLTCSDINNDGLSDMIVYNRISNIDDVKVFYGNDSALFFDFTGNNLYTGSVINQDSYGFRTIKVCDIDADSDLDIVVNSDIYENKFLILENFVNYWNSSVITLDDTIFVSRFDVADFNNNGKPEIVFFDEYNQNVCSIENDVLITDGEEVEIPEIVYTKLHGNYPNPFNPETKISYSTAKAGNAELTIYNIKGQRVKTLVKDHIEAGDHSIIWNGKDDKDADVSSGVYFYRLKTADEIQNKKMLLLK